MKKLILILLPSVLVWILFTITSPHSKIGHTLFASQRHKLAIEMAKSGDLPGTYEGDGFKMDDNQLMLDGDTLTYDVTVHLERFDENEIWIYVKSYNNYSWHISSDNYGNIQRIHAAREYQTVFEYHCYKFFFLKNKGSTGKKEFYPLGQKIFNAVMDDVTKSSK